MAKYRKKPVEIEAFQYDGDLKNSDGIYYVPDWAVKALEENVMFYDVLDMDYPRELFIKTLEGIHHVSVDDYVIQGVNGELYPCKPDIFKKTYEHTGKDSADKNTNADRIRSMSDEELADFIEMKQFFALARNGTDGEDFTLKWLQSEVEV